MKKKYTLILTITILLIKLSNATNLISNGGFESGSSVAFFQHGLGKELNNWDVRNNCGGSTIYLSHSVDWYKAPFFHSSDIGGNFFVHNPHSGDGYIGMIDYELIQQQVYLNDKTPYQLTFYYQLSNIYPLGAHVSSGNPPNSRINIYLSKSKVEYKIECDDNNPCDQDHVDHKHQNDIKTIFSIPININNTVVNGDWIEFSQAFVIDDPSYDWFVIEVVNDPYAAPTSNYESCAQNNVLIDDVFLQSACDNFCVAPLRQPFSYGFMQNGVLQVDQFQPDMGYAPNGVFRPWQAYITDALYVKISIWSYFGGNLIYEKDYFDLFGIKDAGYSDFVLHWDGVINQLGSGGCFSIAGQLLAFNVYIKNCNRIINESFSVLFVDPPPNCNTFFSYHNSSIPNCCPEYEIIDNVYYSTDSRTDVNDYILVGQIGPVGVGSGVNVKFHAGNDVDFGSFFTAQPGSEVEAMVVPCGTNRVANPNVWLSKVYAQDILNKRNIQYDTTGFSLRKPPQATNKNLTVIPNPGKGIFAVSLPLGKEIKKIIVFNNLGQTVLNFNLSEQSTKINISNLAKGIYLVKVLDFAENTYMQKIIKE